MRGNGLCECGCEQPTTIARRSDPRNGDVKGQPRAFIKGHSNVLRRRGQRWREEDRGYDTPCWIWQLSLNDHGYGLDSLGGKAVLAHRHAYEERHGAVPDGLELDHLCRVRACINPDHLEPVTCLINVRRGNVPRIDLARAEEIRAAFAEGVTRADLARRFGLGWTTINNIVHSRTWAVRA